MSAGEGGGKEEGGGKRGRSVAATRDEKLRAMRLPRPLGSRPPCFSASRHDVVVVLPGRKEEKREKKEGRGGGSTLKRAERGCCVKSRCLR